eukprot:TRINITY_DN93767_c0_g1_i1.p1 TRINITY_DN93767_c0_g1~~TRINITY_DN93767_c0_g1_i1.p1  ORF type:complete len:627 (+),score=133.73 TRINITY_DN93767_c0_g1_i1:143-2023(+)
MLSTGTSSKAQGRPVSPVVPMGGERPLTPHSQGSRPDTPMSRSSSVNYNPLNCPSLMRAWIERQFNAIHKAARDRASGKTDGLWQDVNALKEGDLENKERRKEERKYADNIWGRIAAHRYFEAATMVFILLNALAIAADTDYTARFGKPDNLYQGPVFFIIAELTFSIYFSSELIIRFLGMRRKKRCFTDSWFIFDFFLVLLMDVETFILPFIASENSPLTMLSILRLLRLLRVSRMAKLMKTFPELMLIVKGLAAAIRAVGWTGVLLLMILFVWSIVFTSVYHQGTKTDEEVMSHIEEFFGNMSKSMFSLIIMGTLLDDVTNCSNRIRQSGNLAMLAVFIVFIVLSSFMMLNMLLGILVEVVANTAEGEKRDEKNITVRKAMIATVNDLGAGTGGVTKDIFLQMSEDPKVLNHMKELDIKSKHFQSFAKLLYENGEDDEESKQDITLCGEDIVSVLFRLQPGTALNFSDLASTEKALLEQRKQMKRRLSELEYKLSQALGKAVPSRSDTNLDSSNGLSSMANSGGTATGGTATFADAVKPKHSQSVQSLSSVSTPTTFGQGRRFGQGTKKVSLETLTKLNRTDTRDIVNEIQRRLGCEDLETTGVPLDWFDDDMKGRFASEVEDV